MVTYVADIKKNITVDSLSFGMSNFMETRVRATRSPARPIVKIYQLLILNIVGIDLSYA